MNATRHHEYFGWTRTLWLLLAGLGCLLPLIFPPTCKGQVTSAQISGSVKNPTGKAVVGSQVNITNVDTHETRTAVSDKSGNFVFTLVNPGQYTLDIAAPGYKTYKVAPFTVHAGEQAAVQAVLPQGESSETVSGSAIVTTVSQGGISGRAVEDIPQNERNYVNLALIQPGANQGSNAGVASGDSSRPGAEHQSATISVNGQPDTLNQHLLDGMDNNDRSNGTALVHPSVESISSVQVKTSAVTADIGRTSGGALIISSKSGTNKFHGGIFEFFRNDIFDSFPYEFGVTSGLKKLELRQNQFGGSLGGPIRKKRTFFFGDYEGFRLIQGVAPRQITTPTLYEEQNPGKFDDLPGSCNPGKNFTASSFDPIGLKYFQLYPKPNGTSRTTCSGQTVTLNNVWTGSGGNSNNFSHTADARVDHRFRPGRSIFVRFTYNKVSSFAPGVLPDEEVDGIRVSPGGNLQALAGEQSIHGYSYQVNYSHMFNNHWTMMLAASFTTNDVRKYPLGYGTTPNATWGQPGVNISDMTSGLAPITVSNGTGIGVGGYQLPNYNHQNNFQYVASGMWTKGAHTVKFGGLLIRRQTRSVSNNTGDGNWIFTNYYSLLKGTFKSVTRTYALSNPHLQTWEPAGYVTDNWKVNSKLTIDAGVRYEIFTPYTDPRNQISTFNAETGLMQVAGVNGVSSSAGIKTDYNNFGPRVSFALQSWNQTVLKGGFGVGYFMSNMKAKAGLNNTPFTYGYGPCNGTGTTNLCPAGFTTFAGGLPKISTPSIANPSGTVTSAVDPNWNASSVAFYNLSVQRVIAKNNVTVGYVGSQGRHLGQMLPDINTPLPNTGTYTRPYASTVPNLTSISYFKSEGVSSYNAFQAVINRRMQNHLSYNFNYTYAHGLDDSTGVTNPTNSNTGFGELPLQIGKVVQGHRFDYGNSDMDVRHRMATTVTWEIQFGQTKHGIVGDIVKDWRVNTVFSWATGIPYTIANALNISGTLPGTQNSQRPNVVGKAVLDNPGPNAFFNVKAFAYQQPGTIGELLGSGAPVGSIGPYSEPKNYLHASHNRKLDLSAQKSFPLPELWNSKLLFRAEIFNLTNTANFAPPNHSLLMDKDTSGNYSIVNTSNQFGQLTTLSASYTPREVQFVLKLEF